MKHSLAKLLLCALFIPAVWPVYAAELVWFTDLPAAQAKAKAEKKSVLLCFHGSDWCPPCIEMQKEVFDSPEFATYAQQALVLVDVDFPEKANQTAELKQANLALKAKFNVGDGFPCVVLLNGAGETEFQEAGYSGGGPAALLANLQRHAPIPSLIASPAGFKNVEVQDFAKLAADKQNVILDVRTSQEFQSGHLAGALNIDVNTADFEKKVGALDKGKTYLVHCASGVRSAKACGMLSKLDFPNLYNLTGGYRAWVKAGLPVEN